MKVQGQNLKMKKKKIKGGCAGVSKYDSKTTILKILQKLDYSSKMSYLSKNSLFFSFLQMNAI